MKNFVRSLLGVAVLAATIAMSPLAHAELITNGSFEDGEFVPNAQDLMSLSAGSTAIDGWYVTAAPIAWLGASNPWDVKAKAGNGEKFLDLTELVTGGPYGSLMQSISTVVGQEYVLSLDLGSSSSYNGSALRSPRPTTLTVKAAGVEQNFKSFVAGTGVNDWESFSMNFTATSGTTFVELAGFNGWNYLGVDNVSVVEVPEPSSIALACCGLMGALLFVRKRRRG